MSVYSLINTPYSMSMLVLIPINPNYAIKLHSICLFHLLAKDQYSFFQLTVYYCNNSEEKYPLHVKFIFFGGGGDLPCEQLKSKT